MCEYLHFQNFTLQLCIHILQYIDFGGNSVKSVDLVITVWKSTIKRHHDFCWKINLFFRQMNVLLKKLLKSWFDEIFWALLFHTVTILSYEFFREINFRATWISFFHFFSWNETQSRLHNWISRIFSWNQLHSKLQNLISRIFPWIGVQSKLHNSILWIFPWNQLHSNVNIFFHFFFVKSTSQQLKYLLKNSSSYY